MAQAVNDRLDIEERQKAGTFPARLLEPFKRFVEIAQTGVNNRKIIGGNIAFLVQIFETFQNFKGFVSLSCDGVGKAEIRFERQTALRKFDGVAQGFNRFFELSLL